MKRQALLLLTIAVCLLWSVSAGSTAWAGRIDSHAPEKVSPELLKRWEAMTPQERQALRERLKKWQELTSQERENIRKNLERFRQLPPQEQQRLTTMRHRLAQLPPQERQRATHELQRFGRLSPQKRQEMRRAFMLSQTFLRDETNRLREAPPEKRPELAWTLQHHTKVLAGLPRERLAELMKTAPQRRAAALEKIFADHPVPPRPQRSEPGMPGRSGAPTPRRSPAGPPRQN